eukprot:TRINITY_DN2676_c1_g1_i1.p1 TRINITY_DN2676_c1_g1~~TRINITY_DN2676_c1_g1_i1.p1  ORF type:complete len:322 (-),score=88.66 TRINITY_DN2676_c1_g1_i1:77-1042(-)
MTTTTSHTSIGMTTPNHHFTPSSLPSSTFHRHHEQPLSSTAADVHRHGVRVGGSGRDSNAELALEVLSMVQTLQQQLTTASSSSYFPSSSLDTTSTPLARGVKSATAMVETLQREHNLEVERLCHRISELESSVDRHERQSSHQQRMQQEDRQGRQHLQTTRPLVDDGVGIVGGDEGRRDGGRGDGDTGKNDDDGDDDDDDDDDEVAPSLMSSPYDWDGGTSSTSTWRKLMETQKRLERENKRKRKLRSRNEALRKENASLKQSLEEKSEECELLRSKEKEGSRKMEELVELNNALRMSIVKDLLPASEQRAADVEEEYHF